MEIELKKRVSKLLKKYHAVYDVLWDCEERIRKDRQARKDQIRSRDVD